MSDASAVFTPSNEPYLGRTSVEKFDRAIVMVLERNLALAERSRRPGLSAVQVAAGQLIPQGIKLALAVRELVRQGYLFAARVLMRSLVERVAIAFYLEQNPDEIGVWQRGWKYGERPSLPAMLKLVGDRRFEHVEIGPGFTSVYNSLTHGDPASAALNMVFTEDGDPVYGVSKDLDSPEICDLVCCEATVWLGELLLTAERLFPD